MHALSLPCVVLLLTSLEERSENMHTRAVKECNRAPRNNSPGVVDVMRCRQEKNNLSELGVNWLGNGHLNASESDIIYKYHVVGVGVVDHTHPKVRVDVMI